MTPTDFSFLGKEVDPKFWTSLQKKQTHQTLIAYTKAEWEKYHISEGALPDCSYREFKRFFIDGNRLAYENKYFFKRHALATSAVLALIYPEEQKYLDYLQDVIYAICNEYSWALPAHHEDYDTLDDNRLDLFACETGFALAEIYAMLKDRLEPLIRARLLKAVDYRILQSYYKKERIFWWESITNNWAAVCAGSVGCTFLILRPDLFPAVEPRIAATMEGYLSGFGDDGICQEGVGYWNYGFGFFTVYADMVRKFTQGKINYFQRDKVRAIASFPKKIFLNENVSVSFSDGRQHSKCNLDLVHFLKREYPDEVIVPEDCSYKDDCARFCSFLRCFLWMNDEITEGDGKTYEIWAQNAQWLTKRTASYGFAAKGGHNGEPHNHNDVGSFILAKNGKQLLCDLGCGEYTRQYFDPNERYKILCNSSRGHSVPVFGEILQKEGTEFSATADYVPGQLTLELSKAYPLPELNAFQRKFTLEENEVRIEDRFDLGANLPITERFVTQIQPKTDGKTVTIEDITLLPQGNFEIKLQTLDEEFRTHTNTAQYETVYLIDFLCQPGTETFTLTIKL